MKRKKSADEKETKGREGNEREDEKKGNEGNETKGKMMSGAGRGVSGVKGLNAQNLFYRPKPCKSFCCNV